eukprot:Phypoly_transcript_10124.p1 GENE.Phypoly_transcript_10124~~Phypoly_transcript_10124.p1  ORF type:complete len:422 (+),score=66.93 Phypoly_transcript_10124:25-1266(+)
MTGGLCEESWVPVTGRVAATIQAQQVILPPNANANVPDNPEQIEAGDNGERGGDGGDPWVIVLLGKEGSGKSSTGNSILGLPIFEAGTGGHTSGIEVVNAVIQSIEVPIKVVDTPGYGEMDCRNRDNMDRLVHLLQNNIHLVHAFLLVINAEDSDQRHTFSLIRDYVEVFGDSLLANLVIVVSHWSMSERESEIRERNGASREKFTETWIETLGQAITLPNSSNNMIPFVFLDNRVGVGDHDFDETERECFEVSKCAIFQHLSACPVFTCAGLKESAQDTAPPTSRAWTPQSAAKAMTRGWHGRAGGVHLFGKIVARAGLAVQVGFGVYRFVNASNSTEKAKAAIGTGAGIVGGWGGAAWGATVGSFFLPGVGTMLGGIVGGIAGAVGLQMAGERCVDLFAPDVCFSCQKYEM